MIEFLLSILASLLEALLTIAGPLLEFFFAILSIDNSLGESSRLGESPLAREGRRFWRNCALGFWVLILLGAVAGTLTVWCRT